MIVEFGKRLHFAFATAAQAMDQEFCLENCVHFVEIGRSTTEDGASNLSVSIVDAFCEMMLDTVSSHPGQAIVMCLEDLSLSTARHAYFLCGAYLVLCEKWGVEDVQQGFKKALLKSQDRAFSRVFPTVSKESEDCLQALHLAKALNWLGYDEDAPPVLDMEMASHYALPANGNLHVLIPGKLLLVPTPRALPPGSRWADEGTPGQPQVRHFSAAFLAELLVDHGVAAVVCLGRSGGGSDASFRACGIDTHDLGLDASRPALLGALDRLAAVARAAPGPVAVFAGGGGRERARWAGCVTALAESLLMTECGFGEAAAAAWMRMVFLRCDSA